MIVGFNKELYHGEESFEFPEQKESNISIGQILEPLVDGKYTLSDKLWDYLQKYAVRHQEKGMGLALVL